MEETESIFQGYFAAFVTSTVTLSVVGFFVAFYLYRRFYCHTYFKRRGIPGPTPHWLFGNLLSLVDESRRHIQLQEWSQQYGNKFYGYYEGSTPILVISDFEMTKQVTIKQFDLFNARKDIPFLPDPETDTKQGNVFLARGTKWRRLRHAQNPGFATGSLRRMGPAFFKTIRLTLDEIEDCARKGVPVEIFDKFKDMAGQVILESAFGVDIEELRQDGKAKELWDKMQETFDEESNPKSLNILDIILPEFDPIFKVVQLIQEKFYGARSASRYLEGMALEMINRRKADPKLRRPDLLQTMMDVENNDMSEDDRVDLLVDGELVDAGKRPYKGMTTHEIIAGAVVFMVAGFETTSTTTTFVTYLLATNQDKQEKLYQEIMKHVKFDENGYPDPVSISECQYLDWVAKETLRIFPVAAMVLNRTARQKTTVCGLEIPKGQVLHIDQMALHFNPEHWGPVDPQLFYPERFAPDYGNRSEADPSALPFVAFGYGNRRCIGARFGELELKIAMTMLLRKMKVTTCEATKPLALKVSFTIVPSNVTLLFTPRAQTVA